MLGRHPTHRSRGVGSDPTSIWERGEPRARRPVPPPLPTPAAAPRLASRRLAEDRPAAPGRIGLKEASRRYGVAVTTLRTWCRAGEVDAVMGRGPQGRQWMVAPASVAARKRRAGAGGRAAAGPSPDGNAMLVPRDAWDRLLAQLGHLHEAGQQLAEAPRARRQGGDRGRLPAGALVRDAPGTRRLQAAPRGASRPRRRHAPASLAPPALPPPAPAVVGAPVRARIWVAIVVSSLGWGTAGIATRAALREGVGPYTIIGMRILIAAAAVFAYRLLRHRALPDRRLWLLGGVIGLTNITAPYILFTLAVQHASAGFLGLLITNIPLATAVWAHFLLPDEKMNRHKAFGLSLAVAGVALLLATGRLGPRRRRAGRAVGGAGPGRGGGGLVRRGARPPSRPRPRHPGPGRAPVRPRGGGAGLDHAGS